MRRRALAALLLAATTAAADTFALRSGAITAGGGSSRSEDDCYALDGTVGEGADGVAQGGDFVLRAGYWAALGAHARDSLFHDGFQECH